MLGPLLFAPLSERYGRQIILQSTFTGFTVFTLAICLAPNWPAFNVFRLLIGTFASTPISVIGGYVKQIGLILQPNGRLTIITDYMQIYIPQLSAEVVPWPSSWRPPHSARYVAQLFQDS